MSGGFDDDTGTNTPGASLDVANGFPNQHFYRAQVGE